MLNVLQMFYSSFVEDENVVKLHDHNISSNTLINVVISLFKPEGITNHSKKALFGLEGFLPYIKLLNQYLVLSLL